VIKIEIFCENIVRSEMRTNHELSALYNTNEAIANGMPVCLSFESVFE